MKRLAPALVLIDNVLVKTKNFRNYRYVGDPLNILRLYSEKGADEVLLIDKTAFRNGINYSLLVDICGHSFMPITYAGGVSSVQQAVDIISCGVERIGIGIYSQKDIILLNALSSRLGKSGVCAILNIVNLKDKLRLIYDYRLKRPRLRQSVEKLIKALNNSNVGEILLVDVVRDGSFKGFSLDCLSSAFNSGIPLMAYGGVASHEEVDSLWSKGFSGVACSALLTLQPPFDAVMLSYPDFYHKCLLQNLTPPAISVDRYDALSSI